VTVSGFRAFKGIIKMRCSHRVSSNLVQLVSSLNGGSETTVLYVLHLQKKHHVEIARNLPPSACTLDV
jgi:hypothetical protein